MECCWKSTARKTDRVDSAEDVAAKEAHYAPQLAQYQSAIRAVVGADNITTQLVFASPAPSIGDADVI
jgi:hypothetical protein